MFNAEKWWICYNWNHYDYNRMKIATRLFHWMARITTHISTVHTTIYMIKYWWLRHIRVACWNDCIIFLYPIFIHGCPLNARLHLTLRYSTVNFIHFHSQNQTNYALNLNRICFVIFHYFRSFWLCHFPNSIRACWQKLQNFHVIKFQK